ncbi:UNVERIFIED_CONTAM: hypothetical protein Slati_2377900 [Sesamum latifolium]|uniref:Uncharacterized protein n=1 Tax=Sesamum latifolium TaxID=2727402 RepID=A0AAW2WB68_9LAMI
MGTPLTLPDASTWRSGGAYGIKSRDCHVFIQKFISVVFWDMVPEHVWSTLMDINLSFQILYSTTLDLRKVQELEDTVAVIMFNLEKVFPPTFSHHRRSRGALSPDRALFRG